MTNVPQPPVDAPQPGSGGNDKNLAILVWIGGIFFGFIPSLIVWLMNKDKPGWLTDQAREALNFQITLIIAYAAATVLLLVFIGFLLLPAIMILSIVFNIIGAVKASSGANYRCPLAIRLIK